MNQRQMGIEIEIPTDTWVRASWAEYLQIVGDRRFAHAKSYYRDGYLRIEMTPIGNDHASDHTIVTVAASLFASLKRIPANGKDNCTYRKEGVREAQPDISYYIGENANAVPWGTTAIALDRYPAPDLVVEIANTSLADDKGEKRLLYEDLQVREYWIVDVQNAQVIAFAVAGGGSKRIAESQVLPGLQISVLNEALQRTRTTDQSQAIAWLLAQFQSPTVT